MSDVEQSVLDAVADRVISTGVACPESDLLHVLQHVYPEQQIHDALETLTAAPSKLETIPANAGPEYTPTLDGWLVSKHNATVQQVIGVAMRILQKFEDRELSTAGLEWSQLAAEGKFSSRDYPLVRSVLVAASLCDGVASESVWREGQQAQATFRFPLDRAEIARLADVATFVDYRRRTPLLLVYLRKKWARELTPDRRFVLRVIYDHFSKHGDWPTSRDLESKLLAAGRPSLTEVGRDTYLFRSGNPSDERQPAKLTLAGLLHCPSSEEDQRLVVRLLSAAGKVARDRPSLRTITLIELGELVGIFQDDETSLLAFAKLVDSEPDAYFSQSGPDVANHVFALSPRLIKLAEASRLEDILLETYKDEMRSAVSLLNGEVGNQPETQPSRDHPNQLRVPISVNRTPGAAVMSRIEEAADFAGEVAHVWNAEIHVSAMIYLGMWAPSRELYDLLGNDPQDWDVTFGIVSVIRRRVRRSLQSMQGENIIDVSHVHLFQPLKTLDRNLSTSLRHRHASV